MKIRMTVGIGGVDFSIAPGEETERFTEEEAQRLIDAGFAVPPEGQAAPQVGGSGDDGDTAGDPVQGQQGAGSDVQGGAAVAAEGAAAQQQDTTQPAAGAAQEGSSTDDVVDQQQAATQPAAGEPSGAEEATALKKVPAKGRKAKA